jgi:hypothetical protein
MPEKFDDWSLLEVFRGRRLTKDLNPVDVVRMDVPLFIRLLEYAREEAKTDMDLHKVTEEVVELCKRGGYATMQQYARIVK